MRVESGLPLPAAEASSTLVRHNATPANGETRSIPEEGHDPQPRGAQHQIPPRSFAPTEELPPTHLIGEILRRIRNPAVGAALIGAALTPVPGIVQYANAAPLDLTPTSPDHLQSHRVPGPALAAAGKEAIAAKEARHTRSIEKTGVGIYYGDHSSYHSMTPADRAAWIAEHTKPGTHPPTPRESSCIGWSFDNLESAYRKVGMLDRWLEIEHIVAAKGSKGVDLALELQKDGWQAVYFNPDTRTPADGSAEHTASARKVATDGTYYGIKVRHQVVNYRPSPDSKTVQDLRGIKALEQVPFFFGLARGGTHTFVGHDGRVAEFHWTKEPDDPTSIEEQPLQDFEWLSGALMVPPDTWR